MHLRIQLGSVLSRRLQHGPTLQRAHTDRTEVHQRLLPERSHVGPCLRPLIMKYIGGVSFPRVNHTEDNFFFLVALVYQLSHSG